MQFEGKSYIPIILGVSVTVLVVSIAVLIFYLVTTKKKLIDTESDLTKKQSDLINTRSDLNNVRSDLSNIRSDLTDVRSNFEKCTKQTGAGEAIKCGNDLINCTARNDICNADLATRTSNLTTCNSNLATRTTDLATCNTNLGTRTTDLASRTTDLATCNTNLGTRTADLGTRTTDLATCNTNLGTRTTDLATCNTNLGTRTTELATCNTNLGTRTTDLGTCNTNLGTRITDLGTCNTNLGIRTTDLSSRTTDLATCNTNLSLTMFPFTGFASKILHIVIKLDNVSYEIPTQPGLNLMTLASSAIVTRNGGIYYSFKTVIGAGSLYFSSSDGFRTYDVQVVMCCKQIVQGSTTDSNAIRTNIETKFYEIPDKFSLTSAINDNTSYYQDNCYSSLLSPDSLSIPLVVDNAYTTFVFNSSGPLVFTETGSPVNNLNVKSITDKTRMTFPIKYQPVSRNVYTPDALQMQIFAT